MVERFHGAEAARQAAGEFERVYSKDAVPHDVATAEVAPAGGLAELAWALKQVNLVSSTSEARRLVEQGGVEVDGARVTDPKTRLYPGKEYLVRVGSKNRRFARIHVKG
jgi:tyrosyl-tRNA synthetase